MSDVVLLGDCRSQGCRDWVRAGRPYHDSVPIASFKATISGHGFTVYTYPDKSHLTATKPEDHTPFTSTSWPGVTPRWIGNAADVMQKADTAAARKELADLARQMIRDKDAGLPGTEWVKYLNWTDEGDNCWHVAWQPTKTVTRSTDKGHLHVSGRGDWVGQLPAHWDPAARAAGGGTGEDDDMGATYMDGQVGEATAAAPRNVNVGIVEGGAADPRPAWLSFTNDAPGDYALRVVWTGGDNNYQPLAFGGGDRKETAPVNDGYNGTIFHKGWRGSVSLPKGCVAISIIRQGISGGKPVAPSTSAVAYAGPLGFAIERGAVKP